MATAHPHSRRLPRHARHIVKQMLKLRAGTRASVLATHTTQLDSAVNLREHPDRVHPDRDRHALGVRVVVGPETRSLLRQLLDSRDLRVQQQLVREIIHQIQKRALAAAKRARAVAATREAAGKAAQATRATAAATGRAARRRTSWLVLWLRGRPHWARTSLADRQPASGRKRSHVTRSRGTGFGSIPERPARTSRAPRKPASRTARPRANRT